MTLRAFVVADPVASLAELVKQQCQRLAEQAIVATCGEQLLTLAGVHRPEVIVCSLELVRPPIAESVPKLLRMLPDSLVIVAYREMSLPAMRQVERLGIKEFLPHPIDPTEVFRAVSRRFGVAVRQHPRFAVVIDVHRADGVLLGRSRNLSLGGLSFVCAAPQKIGDSLLLQLVFGQAAPSLLRFRVLGAHAEPAGGQVVRGQFENLRGQGLQALVSFLQTQDTLA